MFVMFQQKSQMAGVNAMFEQSASRNGYSNNNSVGVEGSVVEEDFGNMTPPPQATSVH